MTRVTTQVLFGNGFVVNYMSCNKYMCIYVYTCNNNKISFDILVNLSRTR